MTRVKECVLYRGFEHGEILDKMTALMDACEKSAVNAKEMEEDFYECVNGLIETAGSYGFAGNLWHNYLTLLLVNNENAFSTASEIRGHIDGSSNELALHDFAIFKELYDFDLNLLDKVFHTSCCGILCDYQAPKDSGKMFNKRIRDRICEMSRTLAAAKDTKEFMEDMVQVYKEIGVGKLGLHKAFRIEKDENGKAQITGSMTYEEADNIASTIRIGGLNVELEELSSEVVGAQLGQEAVSTSLIAGAIGLALVCIFMCWVYLLPGLAASMALLLYTEITLHLLNAFDITLTLPGIAGIILGIGMAVDANVFIYARIQEEIAAGSSVRTSIKAGFHKAMSAIIDGNVTTLLAAGVLWLRGSGSVKGIAQTLALGIVIYMYTALENTRLIIF